MIIRITVILLLSLFLSDLALALMSNGTNILSKAKVDTSDQSPVIDDTNGDNEENGVTKTSTVGEEEQQEEKQEEEEQEEEEQEEEEQQKVEEDGDRGQRVYRRIKRNFHPRGEFRTVARVALDQTDDGLENNVRYTEQVKHLKYQLEKGKGRRFGVLDLTVSMDDVICPCKPYDKLQCKRRNNSTSPCCRCLAEKHG